MQFYNANYTRLLLDTYLDAYYLTCVFLSHQLLLCIAILHCMTVKSKEKKHDLLIQATLKDKRLCLKAVVQMLLKYCTFPLKKELAILEA